MSFIQYNPFSSVVSVMSAFIIFRAKGADDKFGVLIFPKVGFNISFYSFTIGKWGHAVFGPDPINFCVTQKLMGSDPKTVFVFIFLQLIGEISSNLQRNMIRTSFRVYYILVTLTLFSRTAEDKQCQILVIFTVNLSDSNMDSSFTVDNSNSFPSP